MHQVSRRFRRINRVARSGLVGGLFMCLFLLPAVVSCDTALTPEQQTALALLNSVFDKQPSPGIGAKSILPGSLGPNTSVFGLLLDDNSRVYLLGSVAADGTIKLTTAVYYDSNGNLVSYVEFGTDRMLLGFPTGDQAVIDATSGETKLIVTLNASNPLTTISMRILPSGELEIIDSETTYNFGAANSNYDPEVRVKSPDTRNTLHKPGLNNALPSCAQVGDALVFYTGVACDIKGFITDKAPIFIIQKMCVTLNRGLDFAISNASPDSILPQTLSGLKVGITVTCEGLKTATQVAATATKITPVDAACLALSLASDGVTAATGESLAQQLCKIFTSDQQLGGIITTATSIQLNLVDTATEDGDQVEVKHNGSVVFSGTVTNAGNTVTVNLAPGLNHFEFRALNEGTLPPNMGQVNVLGLPASSATTTTFDLTVGQVATLDIIRA